MKHKDAAEAYVQAFKYDEAATEYVREQMLDEAVALVMSYHASMTAELVNEIKSLGKLCLSEHSQNQVRISSVCDVDGTNGDRGGWTQRGIKGSFLARKSCTST